MNRRFCVLACGMLAAGVLVTSQDRPRTSLTVTPPLLLGTVGEVALSRTDVAFSYMGDLWSVPRSGGVATRLTDTPAEEEGFPVFSPDGQSLAYARGAGDQDVYVIAAGGGVPRRLTYFPKADLPVAWTPDGREIVFASPREGDNQFARLYTIPSAGVFETALPLPAGVQGSFSPDAKRLAYLPKSYPMGAFGTWRHYRGGMTSPLWIVSLSDLQIERVTSDAANARYPMWIGDRIYFVFDQTGTFNLYEYDTRSKRTRALTSFDTFGIDGAAASHEAIAFVRGGRIFLYDLKTAAQHEVSFSLEIAAPELAPRQLPATRWVESVEHAGDRVVIGARGDVHLFNPETGESQSLTNTPGVAERSPTLSPDGRRLAFFSDESGEYELHIRDVDSGSIKKIRIEPRPSFYREPTWSPDSRALAFSDIRLALWLADTQAGTARQIDVSRYIAQDEYRPDWSPDGRFVTYAKARSDGLKAAFIYDTAHSRVHQITDGLTHVESPVFDQSGRSVSFISSSNARLAPAADIGWGLLSSELARPLVRRTLHAIAVPADPIDFTQRPPHVVPALPGFRDYAAIRAGVSGRLYVAVTEWPSTPGAGAPTTTLYRTDGANPRLEKIADNVAENWTISRDRTRVVYAVGTDRFVAAAAGPPARLDLQRIRLQIDPALEWRQMYREAWRQMRDTFYDPGHHGQDIDALERHYQTLLPSVTRRAYLNRLFLRMLGHVSVSHLQVGGGDVLAAETAASAAVGDIGADFVLEGDRYRFAKIVGSPHFSAAVGLLNAPLDRPGIAVREGDYLIAVDGQPVDGSRNVWAWFAGKVNQPVTLTVSASAAGNATRQFTVVPNAGTGALRNQYRGEVNRRRVDALSNGTVAYAYIGAYNQNGIDAAMRAVIGLRDRQALIIDQRDNGGGVTSDALIDALNRQSIYDYAYRYGDGFQTPPNAFAGPKVLITSSTNFSAAETFALMFKLTRAGTIVGERTGGGGIGAALFQPPLIDGGRIFIPNRAAYNPAGTWDIENNGVTPDVSLERLPRDWRDGRDPQLERAVQLALDAVKRERRVAPRRPPYPIHK